MIRQLSRGSFELGGAFFAPLSGAAGPCEPDLKRPPGMRRGRGAGGSDPGAAVPGSPPGSLPPIRRVHVDRRCRRQQARLVTVYNSTFVARAAVVSGGDDPDKSRHHPMKAGSGRLLNEERHRVEAGDCRRFDKVARARRRQGDTPARPCVPLDTGCALRRCSGRGELVEPRSGHHGL